MCAPLFRTTLPSSIRCRRNARQWASNSTNAWFLNVNLADRSYLAALRRHGLSLVRCAMQIADVESSAGTSLQRMSAALAVQMNGFGERRTAHEVADRDPLRRAISASSPSPRTPPSSLRQPPAPNLRLGHVSPGLSLRAPHPRSPPLRAPAACYRFTTAPHSSGLRSFACRENSQ
jgi:hypothetical protein